ncbi:Restriction endonuclease [Pacmanvirus A23]|uniref:Restriction endonuclease n=1 Tax=Pacmanvirus A23 TaxID=1932881 RepID=UPI000A091D46|nr:Restriction endonuclease [Pacmanvirus A23]SIP85823.1 Restriction endonuclease [Pacmanvirus A23]
MCDYPKVKKLCTYENCQICFEKSFASHPKSQYWSNDNKVTARQVTKGAGTKYVFDCDICNHKFTVNPRNIGLNRWCSYCANKILCSDKNCQVCFKKSFANHKKSKYWSDKNILKPRDVFLSSCKKYMFNCKCGHEITLSLNHISCEGKWCAYCSNNILCLDNSCQICFNKSFASHPKSQYWSNKNNTTPRQTFLQSNNKYIFLCNECNNEFSAFIYHINNMGVWCPCIHNKTEAKLYEFLKRNNYNVTRQPKFSWCKNDATGRLLPYDFLVEEFKLIIELDGGQHFKQVMDWKSPEEQQKRDLYKMKCANEREYTVIRILQNDVWLDKNNWFDILINCIKNYDIPKRIYISSGNEYRTFIDFDKTNQRSQGLLQ